MAAVFSSTLPCGIVISCSDAIKNCCFFKYPSAKVNVSLAVQNVKLATPDPA